MSDQNELLKKSSKAKGGKPKADDKDLKDLPTSRDELHDLIGNNAIQNLLVQELADEIFLDVKKAAEEAGLEAEGPNEISAEAWNLVDGAEDFLSSWVVNQEQLIEDEQAARDPAMRPNRVFSGMKGMLSAGALKEIRIWAEPDYGAMELASYTSGKMVEVDEVQGGWMKVLFDMNGKPMVGWVRSTLFTRQPDLIRKKGYWGDPSELQQQEGQAAEEEAHLDSSTATEAGAAGANNPKGGGGAAAEV
jgi:hypothetical protein